MCIPLHYWSGMLKILSIYNVWRCVCVTHLVTLQCHSELTGSTDFYRLWATRPHFHLRAKLKTSYPSTHHEAQMAEYQLNAKETSILTEGKWPQWSRKVRAALRANETWIYIEGSSSIQLTSLQST